MNANVITAAHVKLRNMKEIDNALFNQAVPQSHLDGQAYAKQRPPVKMRLLVLQYLVLTYDHPHPNQAISLGNNAVKMSHKKVKVVSYNNNLHIFIMKKHLVPIRLDLVNNNLYIKNNGNLKQKHLSLRIIGSMCTNLQEGTLCSVIHGPVVF